MFPQITQGGETFFTTSAFKCIPAVNTLMRPQSESIDVNSGKQPRTRCSSLPVQGIKCFNTAIYTTIVWLFLRVHSNMNLQTVRCKKLFIAPFLRANERILS